MWPPALLEYFEYEHMPEVQHVVSKPFYDLAHKMALEWAGPETETGLRKLLEARDCFIRARLYEPSPPNIEEPLSPESSRDRILTEIKGIRAEIDDYYKTKALRSVRIRTSKEM